MTRLQRLLYVADAGSEDRTFPHARRIRRAGERDLMAGLRLAAKAKLDWVRSQGGWVHPLGEATLKWAMKTQDARR
jgi:HD superfamily phosphohydrolase YqeK